LGGDLELLHVGEVSGAEKVLEKQDVYEEKQEYVCMHLQEPGDSYVT
jgi:hypothetical protein